MEFMLDSANLEEIKQVKKLGLLDGLTTNPIIFKRGFDELKYTGNFFDYAKWILEITGDKPCFFQVAARSKESIIHHARVLYSQLSKHGNVHIKVPIDTRENDSQEQQEGFEAIKTLTGEKIPVLATAIVTPVQAYLAARAGAKYAVLMLRPYDDFRAEQLGIKLDKSGYLDTDFVRRKVLARGMALDTYLCGFDTLQRTARIFETQNLETKLIIAGIRNQLQVSEVLATKGVDAITIPYFVFTSLFPHSKTQKFVADTYGALPESYRQFLENGT
ncbi:MAG: transaldolase family protein [Candidatus Woesearchaeota archaeon]|nr:transaldolase family protein [Candidatus Woesearchaeota archaeon]